MTLEAIIVDDEELARDRIRGLLDEHDQIRVRAECRCGREAIEAIRSLDPDLVFLDIQMPDVDGFGVIEQIGVENMPPVIFVTAFDEHAVHAFETDAVDYLLKPFDRDRFDQALARTLKRCGEDRLEQLDRRLDRLLARVESRERFPDRLIVRSAGTIHFVRLDHVDWVEAARNYVRIHCGAEVYTMRETMARMEARLDPERFLRIHRSTLVNIDRIRKIEPGIGTEAMVELEDGTRLMISRAYRRGKVKDLLS